MDLTDRIKKSLRQIYVELRSVEGSLRNDQTGRKIQGLICISCGRTHPISAQECHHCRNYSDSNALHTKYCTSDHRVAEYSKALRKFQLRSSLEPFQYCFVEEIARCISTAEAGLGHSCETGNSCLLLVELGKLVRRVDGILEKIEGLDLYPLQLKPLDGED